MTKEQKFAMLGMVCTDPEGEGVVVDSLPDMVHHDLAEHTQPHTHTFYELIWFRSSGGTHTVDFHDYPIEENTIFFIAPGQVHHFTGETEPKGYSIKIASGQFDECRESSYTLRHNLFFSTTEEPVAHIDEETAEILLRLIRQMRAEQKMKDCLHHKEMMVHLGMELMIVIERRMRRNPYTVDEKLLPQQVLFMRFRDLVEENHDHLHLVSDYARILRVSTKTLTTAVRRSTGKTPLVLIDERLILEAKRLLRYSKLMVKEIAFQLGFEDPSNFVKFFRRHTGSLPGRFTEKKSL